MEIKRAYWPDSELNEKETTEPIFYKRIVKEMIVLTGDHLEPRRGIEGQRTIITGADAHEWMRKIEERFHSPKNLSMSISIEAAEISEIFQWCTEKESYDLDEARRSELEHEIADVLIYSLELADKFDIDVIEAIKKKIELNKQKYPADECKSSSKKYTEI